MPDKARVVVMSADQLVALLDDAALTAIESTVAALRGKRDGVEDDTAYSGPVPRELDEYLSGVLARCDGLRAQAVHRVP